MAKKARVLDLGVLKNRKNVVHNYQCTICQKMFRLPSQLNSHVEIAHETMKYPGKYHKCDSCEKIFNTAQGLKDHINSVHAGQKDHKCASCGKGFSKAESLQQHIMNKH